MCTRDVHVLHGNGATKSQWATRVKENEDRLLDVSVSFFFSQILIKIRELLITAQKASGQVR